jgi:hypothetical protein
LDILFKMDAGANLITQLYEKSYDANFEAPNAHFHNVELFSDAHAGNRRKS